MSAKYEVEFGYVEWSDLTLTPLAPKSISQHVQKQVTYTGVCCGRDSCWPCNELNDHYLCSYRKCTIEFDSKPVESPDCTCLERGRCTVHDS